MQCSERFVVQEISALASTYPRLLLVNGQAGKGKDCFASSVWDEWIWASARLSHSLERFQLPPCCRNLPGTCYRNCVLGSGHVLVLPWRAGNFGIPASWQHIVCILRAATILSGVLLGHQELPVREDLWRTSRAYCNFQDSLTSWHIIHYPNN